MGHTKPAGWDTMTSEQRAEALYQLHRAASARGESGPTMDEILTWRPAPRPAPSASELARARIAGAQRFLEGSAAALVAIRAAHLREVAAARAEAAIYQPAITAQRVRAADDRYHAALAAHEAEARAAHERVQLAAQRAIGAAASRLSGPEREAAVAAWNRLAPVLARASTGAERVQRIQQAISDAGRQGDVATLRALKAELPAYLEASEPSDARARRVAAGRTSFAEHDELLKRLLSEVHTASVPHLEPAERAGHELAQSLEPYARTVPGNIARLRAELADPSGRSRVEGLAGWEPRSYVPVEPPAPAPTE